MWWERVENTIRVDKQQVINPCALCQLGCNAGNERVFRGSREGHTSTYRIQSYSFWRGSVARRAVTEGALTGPSGL